jgi:hypothetical protein
VITVQEDEHGKFDIAIEGDHLNLFFEKNDLTFDDIKRYGNITIDKQ